MSHWRAPRGPYERDFFWAIVWTGVIWAGVLVLALWLAVHR